MKANFIYIFSVTLASPDSRINDYKSLFPLLVSSYNSHVIPGAGKQLLSLRVARNPAVLRVCLATERSLSHGKEILALRRFSQHLGYLVPDLITETSCIFKRA